MTLLDRIRLEKSFTGCGFDMTTRVATGWRIGRLIRRLALEAWDRPESRSL